MSVEPPSSGRPTGPPSGPLSGPSQPPSGPPSEPPGSGGAHTPEPGRPWWRSAPRVAVLASLVVAAVVLAIVFTRSDGGSGGGQAGGSGEVFLQAAAKTGPDPFTESTATDSSAPPASVSPATDSAPANAVRGVDGGAPGLYGGTRDVASCDVEKQVSALQDAPAKNKAFASVAGVEASQVPAYLRSLTPVQLRMDTRVTNHGYRDGAATGYQAVLQSGTAVLVDGHGVPRVRCACGNPLTPPVAQQTTPRRTGDSWPSYHPSNVVVVAPAAQVVNIFVIYDPDRGDWFSRHHGDTGEKDKKTDPPRHRPSPSVSVSPSASPCVTLTGDDSTGTPTPGGSASPCPATSTTPSSPSPSSESPSSEPPAPDSDTSAPPSPDSDSPQAPLASDSTATTSRSASSGTPSTSPAL